MAEHRGGGHGSPALLTHITTCNSVIISASLLFLANMADATTFSLWRFVRRASLFERGGNITLAQLRTTTPDRTAAGVRIFLGILFLMTGLMKVFVPALGDAFAGQLAAAELPLQGISRWIVPLAEIGIGATMLRGSHSRLSAVVVLGIMSVATYVHVAVEDPTLFPLQPSAPIIPVVTGACALFILLRGGGAGSRDLKLTDSAST